MDAGVDGGPVPGKGQAAGAPFPKKSLTELRAEGPKGFEAVEIGASQGKNWLMLFPL